MVTGTGRTRRELLAAFIPHVTLDLDRDTAATHTSVDGSMLSADISGFTALSERQSAKGPSGAEELAEIMSACFTDLIDAAIAHGGDVVKFGGDALLILFRGDDHQSRAAHAAAALQRALRSSRAARRSGLTMTVGVGAGPFDVFTVGSLRRELLVAGPAADRVIELESAAATGETLLDRTIADHVDRQWWTERDLGGGNLAMTLDVEAGASAAARPVSATSTTPVVIDDLARFVPPPVVAQLDAFAQLGGEHRAATVGFLAVDGLNELIAHDPADAARELGGIVDAVSRACRRRGVAPLETDIAIDGFKFVLSAGAPVTRGSDSDALLSSALEILRHPTPLGMRIGSQRGRVFAGFIGHPRRWTYSMTGDCMSTAARMAAKASDRSIIAVDDVVADVRTPFATEELPPFPVKGKSALIHAHLVTGIERAVFSAGDQLGHGLIGRSAEIARVTALLTDAAGRVDVVGDAGAGGTSVLRAAVAAAGLEVHGGRPLRDAGEPYHALRDPLLALVGLPAEDAHERDLVDVLERLAPDLVELAPLVGDVLGIEVEATERSDAIGEAFRRARTIDAVVDLVAAVDVDQPTAIAVDDAQWLDESSVELLEALAQRHDTSVAVAVVSRPGGSWVAPDPDRVVRLERLANPTIRQIAIERSERALSDRDLGAIVERSAGNPLFATELARSLGGGASTSELPLDLERLIASRIDELAPPARRVLRLASVVGRDVAVETLAAMLAGVDVDEVTRTLDEDLDGVMSVSEGVGRFVQSVHRDVAYAGLPFRERRRLHRLVAERIEAGIRTDLDDHVAALSVHWHRAGRFDRSWTVSSLAGDRAARLASPGDAIDAYERALVAAARTRSVTPRQRSRIATRLGDVAVVAGRYDVATAAYARARRALRSDDPDQVALFRKVGIVHERGGRYARAVSWYERGLAAADELDHAADGERDELLVAIAGIRFRQGRHNDAHAGAAPVANDVAATPTVRLRACYVAQLALQYLGLHEQRDHFGALGLELAEVTDDPVIEANLTNNLGIAAYYDGDWDRAGDLYADALERREASGDLIGAVTSLINLGELRSDQRRYAEARQLFEEALRRATAAEYEIAIHVTNGNLGRLATREGRLDDARRLLRAAAAAFDAMDSATFSLETRLRLFEVDLPTRAEITQLLDDNARDGGGATITVPALRLLAVRHRVDGDLDGARAHVDDAIELARSERLDAEVTWCLDELAAIDEIAPVGASTAAQDAAAQRRRLGIVGQDHVVDA